ncbi:MAG: hypothetical protein DWB43_06915 [Lautropia sp.]|nr:MAG: hypothetical protein EDM78_00045 [Pseudomonadota bacterium]MBC6959253.1 hypothetical protein [Lautropia sp.]MDL1907483.1 hypothetical protein [Betaproteobacteria bacterium PRO1]RIK86488.1 MAG: hypothetical protein DCC70_13715 [Burkholderiales bacterium]
MRSRPDAKRAAADLGFRCLLAHDACATRALRTTGAALAASRSHHGCCSAVSSEAAERSGQPCCSTALPVERREYSAAPDWDTTTLPARTGNAATGVGA